MKNKIKPLYQALPENAEAFFQVDIRPKHYEPRKIIPNRAFQKAYDAGCDLWGRQIIERGEPSWEAVKDLFAQIRYVHSDMMGVYPIILSLKDERRKRRLWSNGSCLDLRLDPKRHDIVGFNESSVSVKFAIGKQLRPFGHDLKTIAGPFYLNGYLPIVSIVDQEGGAEYTLQVFVAPPDSRVKCSMTCVSMRIRNTSSGTRVAKLGLKFKMPGHVILKQNDLVELSGFCSARVSGAGFFDEKSKTLVFEDRIQVGQTSCFYAIFPDSPQVPHTLTPVDDRRFSAYRNRTCSYWNILLTPAAQMDVPEPLIINAVKTLCVANHMIATDDQMNYGSANGYGRLAPSECYLPISACSFWGLRHSAENYLRHLMTACWNYDDHDSYVHLSSYPNMCRALTLRTLATHALLCHPSRPNSKSGYFIQHEKGFFRLADFICNQIQRDPLGLVPKEGFYEDAPDVLTYPLRLQTLAWQGLFCFSVLLSTQGRHRASRKYKTMSELLRKNINRQIRKVQVKSGNEVFVPDQLMDKVKPSATLCRDSRSTYYQLIMPYVLESSPWGTKDNSPEVHILNRIHNKGGVFCGMITYRAFPDRGEDFRGIDDLYGFGYKYALLKADKIDEFLLALYSSLAHTFTRNTFIAGEVSSLECVENPWQMPGRVTINPPNSSANGMMLLTIRHMLVLEACSKAERSPDTLKLLWGIPRRWLENGKTIRIKNAPTFFGKISLSVKSQAAKGVIDVTLDVSHISGLQHIELRLRHPENKPIQQVTVDNRPYANFNPKKEIIIINPVHKGTIKTSAFYS